MIYVIVSMIRMSETGPVYRCYHLKVPALIGFFLAKYNLMNPSLYRGGEKGGCNFV